MARTKQTGPEIKLYQIDTMVYLGTKNIITKLSMFAEFLKEGGVAIADHLNLNRARALERYDKNYKISDIKELTTDGQANETWLRKNGLLYSVDGRYELSPIANAILNGKITLADYCFLLLTKQWIKIKELGGKDEYKENLLSIILTDLIKHSIPVGDFVSHVGQIALDKYKDEYEGLALSNQEAARFLIEPLLISKLIEEKKGEYALNPNMQDLAADYVNNTKQIKRIDQVACADEEYWNSFQYGFYDLINKGNELLYIKHYPHLFAMKELYKDNGALPLQKIKYGAPGTGKSNGLKDLLNSTRVTFHPDTDYSTFIGCYKPTMSEDGKEIKYSFVAQAFLDTIIKAWNKPEESYNFIIEEINRGNCAQIFGDFFQLLDRDDETGYSSYTINVDADMWNAIVGQLPEDYASRITSIYSNGDPNFNAYGKLALPNNLSIIATMNTSDQNLFPMDSAFKRRWDWEYVPINYDDGQLKDVKLEGFEDIKWMDILIGINIFIKETLQSAAKQLGQWFVKPKNKVISQKAFVDKVLFYLFNDAFKGDNSLNELFGKDEDMVFLFEDLLTLPEEEKKEAIKTFVEKVLEKLPKTEA